jgi:phosphoribosyl 1,2-cyclic phosphodiesterase
VDVCFWGVRGSIPSPPSSDDLRKKILHILSLASKKDISTNEKRVKFMDSLTQREIGFLGGNTPCVELRVANKRLIFDMGTGLRKLGDYLMKTGASKEKLELHIFIGHTHWDHIQGLPFFIPAYRKNTTIHFYFVHPPVKERLELQQDYRFFPVSLDYMAAKKIFHQLENNSVLNLDGITIRTTESNHPGKSFCYRVEYEGKSFIYASDGEYNTLQNDKISHYIEFYRNADMLVFDAPFSFSEEIEKINWGHSSALVGVDISVKANVKKLAVFHHAPEYDDEGVFELLRTAAEYKEQNYPAAPLEVILAREGLVVTL